MNEMFIKIRSNPEKCKDPMKFCSLMAKDINGDLPSLFNFRRELLVKDLGKEDVTPEKAYETLKMEMGFLAKLMKANPKSY